MRDLNEVLDELDGICDCFARIPLPTDDLLDSYQAELGVVFPPEYRDFIKRENNANYGSKEIFVLTEKGKAWPELRVGIEDARQLGVPKDWLPVCMDNGDSYCITPSGEVSFWSHDGPTNESWPSLADWIKDVWIEGK